MTIDTLGMIRRGWQDSAATVAPHVLGLADLLEKRLAEAIRLGSLDEASLLAIVDAATQLAANSGAVDVVPALSKRLRRHVYEYLLSLDAAGDVRSGNASPRPQSRDDGGLLIGADEIAALHHDRGREVAVEGVESLPLRGSGPRLDVALARSMAPQRDLPSSWAPDHDISLDRAPDREVSSTRNPEHDISSTRSSMPLPDRAPGRPAAGPADGAAARFPSPTSAGAAPRFAPEEPAPLHFPVVQLDTVPTRTPAPSPDLAPSRTPADPSDGSQARAAADVEMAPAHPASPTVDGAGARATIMAEQESVEGTSPAPAEGAAGRTQPPPEQPANRDGGSSGGGPATSGAPAPHPSPVSRFSFHLGDPDDLHSSAREQPATASEGSDALTEIFSPDDLQPPSAATPRRASFSDPSTWPRPIAPSLRSEHLEPVEAEALSPADLTRPQPAPTPVEPDFQELTELSWPAGLDEQSMRISREVEPNAPAPTQWPAREPAAPSAPEPAVTTPAAWPPRDLVAPSAPAPRSGNPPVPRTPSPPTPAREPVDPWPSPDSRILEPAAWSVRQPESVELHLAPAVENDAGWPPVTDQVSERDLVQLRAAVEERLRRKRCDDAAAILQQAAQELGGQAVAELALDAGDRCRTLGKRNAALNCYLAASRADPVYEAPLARLADICIDDQDIDLAVSYLERIARLTRLRGDQRGAVRIYRKIATIAPYRDDVLEILMRAQTTGRIDG